MNKSRFGFHPCNYEVYKILKQLSYWYLDALRRKASWLRWKNKQPQNRVYITRGAGGIKIIGEPRPEPPWTDRDEKLKKELEKIQVVAEYRYARTPFAREIRTPAAGNSGRGVRIVEYSSVFVKLLYELAKEANKV